ncbi:carbohydrate isomerase [Achromobacter sp. UBA2119]|uniref:carbohydrate isomerase n=1 Tax=Achromobacter sp. UBA2119 TaxID=1945911 RepID=UPI00257C3C44|nr:carbohydrate isomerase [Achromobacter sp. UBA2119]
MSIYVITAVRRNPETGNVTRVLWGMADPDANGWNSPQIEADAMEAVDAIMSGDTVTTRHASGGLHVAGRDVRVEVQADGVEVLRSEASDDVNLRGLEDLPEF